MNKVTLWTSVGTAACLLDFVEVLLIDGVGDDRSETHGGPLGVVILFEEYLKIS